MRHFNQNSQTKYIRASARVAELRRFYGRIFKGLLAIIIVAAINYYLEGWSNPWFLWVVFGVGLGIGLRAIKLFGTTIVLGRDWEARKIEQLMNE